MSKEDQKRPLPISSPVSSEKVSGAQKLPEHPERHGKTRVHHIVQAVRGSLSRAVSRLVDKMPKRKPKLEDFLRVPEGAESLNWILKRRERIFPWTKREIQFDNGGAPSASEFYYEAVREYGRHAAKSGYGRMDEGGYPLIEKETREEAAKLLGCDWKEIAFIQNTSVGVNIVAQGIDWQKGDVIVVVRSDKEYPTNYVPWKRLERLGVKIEEVGDENGFVTPRQIEEKLRQHEGRVRLVTVSSVGWKNGRRVDLKGIGELIQAANLQAANLQAANPASGAPQSSQDSTRRRTLFHVDAIQSIGAHPLNVHDSHIDFLSAGSSKWMLAEGGNGIFYCRENAVDELPNGPVGADSLENWKDSRSALKKIEDPPKSGIFHPTAQVFETGQPNMQGISGLRAALKVINHVGVSTIEKRINELHDYLVSEAHKKGYIIVNSPQSDAEKSGMVFLSTPALEAMDLKSREEYIGGLMPDLMHWDRLSDSNYEKGPISQRGIAASPRDGRLRISIHYYNIKEEIDELVRRLPRIF